MAMGDRSYRGNFPNDIEMPPEMRDREQPLYGPGNLVLLKSGGPCMTVYDVQDGGDKVRIHCEWFDGAELRRDVFMQPELLRTTP